MVTQEKSSPRHALLATLTEREWHRQVVEWAHRGGWKVYHTYDSRRSDPGWPDLVLVKLGRRVIYAELKAENGRLTRDQRDWLNALSDCPMTDVRVWRPSDEAEVREALGPMPWDVDKQP